MLDANGQLTVTYIAPGEKTIATALAGVNPPNLDQLKNEDMVRAGKTEVMLRPRDFFKNASYIEGILKFNFILANKILGVVSSQ